MRSWKCGSLISFQLGFDDAEHLSGRLGGGFAARSGFSQ